MTNELHLDELDAVCGGTRDLAHDIGFQPTYRTPGGNPSSPLFGNGSYRDTIDNNDNLP
jgi:hypothetical protein